MNTPYTNPSTIVDVTDDKPKRVAPVPEEYAGWNNPYRGTNHHGVDIENPYQEPLIQTVNDVEEYEHTDPPAPIPVKVVAERESVFHRTVAYNLTQSPVQIVGRNNRRKRVVLRATRPCYISHSLTDSTDQFYLDSNNVLELFTNEAVYAKALFPPILPTVSNLVPSPIPNASWYYWPGNDGAATTNISNKKFIVTQTTASASSASTRFATHIPVDPLSVVTASAKVSGVNNFAVRIQFFDAAQQQISPTLGTFGNGLLSCTSVSPLNAATMHARVESVPIMQVGTVAIWEPCVSTEGNLVYADGDTFGYQWESERNNSRTISLEICTTVYVLTENIYDTEN